MKKMQEIMNFTDRNDIKKDFRMLIFSILNNVGLVMPLIKLFI